MTWEPKPTPEVNPETYAYWAAASDGDLLLSKCNECGLVYSYPRTYCPDCFSDDVSDLVASGTGSIHAFTCIEQVPDWPEKYLPILLCYVELDEGPRIVSNIVNQDPEDVSIGDRVTVDFVPTQSEDIAIPVFTLIGDRR